MTRTLAVDVNNDIFIGVDGSLSIATARDAVMQACAEAAKAQLGEMIYAVDQGLPNFQAVWNGAPNLNQFEAYLRRTIEAVVDVIGVDSVAITADAGVLSYIAVIKTIYGPGTLNG